MGIRLSMKFWLSCFFLLFVAAELFEWAAQVGGVQPHGAWLILGGMGLAAASNAAHLPKLSSSEKGEAIAKNPPIENQTEAPHREPIPQPDKPTFVAEQSQEDSISFKVRLPWR